MTEPKLDVATKLAVDRTLLAHDRTLMAWVRTATSLISFGFTIYKFFQFEAGKESAASNHVLSPRQFALIMIATGLVALSLATVEHSRSTREMRAQFGVGGRSTPVAVAVIVSAMGLVALFVTFVRG